MDKYYISSNPRFSHVRNPSSQRTSLQKSPPLPSPPSRSKNRRSPDFQGDPSFIQGDPNFNQGTPQHQNHFPNARIDRVEAFTSSQVDFDLFTFYF